MPEAKIERVAQAMRNAYAKHIGETIVPWARSAPDVKAAWTACAEAAIKECEKP